MMHTSAPCWRIQAMSKGTFWEEPLPPQLSPHFFCFSPPTEESFHGKAFIKIETKSQQDQKKNLCIHPTNSAKMDHTMAIGGKVGVHGGIRINTSVQGPQTPECHHHPHSLGGGLFAFFPVEGRIYRCHRKLGA